LDRQAPERVASLDLIRGVAVLGILAINISGFAGPVAGIYSPHQPQSGSFADEVAFAARFLLFEGKMRALFTILFGASLVLFAERADGSGRFGELLQLRRLMWLALFGLAHFYLLWWGDILFLYAVCGVIALFMLELRVRTLVVTALAIFFLWHLAGGALDAPELAAKQRVAAGTGNPKESKSDAAYRNAVKIQVEREETVALDSFAGHARQQFGKRTLDPLLVVLSSFGETLPLMLLGIALCRTGFFAGSWPRRRMARLAATGTLTGLAMTAAALAWAWPHRFPLRAMESAFTYWLAIPHLLMAAGYAALLVLATPAISASAFGHRLVATGRTAFSNYIATSILMTGIFYGWGLGLFGTVGHAAQWVFVLLGWVLMLAWSGPWLAHFRRGPLEWLWRSLTEGRMLAMRF